MRWAIAALLLLHGMAHFVGVAGSWDLLPREQRAHRTTILRGRLDLGARGMQIWGFAALALVVVAVGGFLAQPWWVTAAAVAAGTSLLLTLAELPDARLGVLINVGVLALLLMGRHFLWL